MDGPYGLPFSFQFSTLLASYDLQTLSVSVSVGLLIRVKSITVIAPFSNF